jgi:hypothetical protein
LKHRLAGGGENGREKTMSRHFAVRNKPFNKYAPKPPLCPACAQMMRLARIPRFGDLPDVYIFECRASGVSHIEAAYIEAA